MRIHVYAYVNIYTYIYMNICIRYTSPDTSEFEVICVDTSYLYGMRDLYHYDACMRMYKYFCIYTYICIHIHMHIYTYICIHIYMHIYTYICIHLYMHIYMYIYVYKHVLDTHHLIPVNLR